MPSRSTREGFTLIEMMIVVVIIAVLVAVAIVTYTRHIKNSRIAQEKIFVSKIQAMQETYFQQHGVYCDVTQGSFYPTSSPVPTAAYAFDPSNTTRFAALGAKPDSGSSYFAWDVTASAAPNHGLAHQAGSLGLTAGIPWYYIRGFGDLNGDGSIYTEIYSTSLRSTIWTRNDGE